MKAGIANPDLRGFTLIELLIVMMMMGIVSMAIISLYRTSQRTASNQEQVVELQQNLRVAMDQITRDIRNTGFMVAGTGNSISNAGANTITLQTASTDAKIAQIAVAFDSPTNNVSTQNVTVVSADMVDLFETGDWVRIIRPPDHGQPLNDTFQVATGKDRTLRRLVLQDFNTASSIAYQPGDIIVRIPSSTTNHPRTIAYALNGTNLDRIDGVSDPIQRIVASGISALNFNYILDSSGDIRAVSVTLTGQATTLEGTETRSLTSVIRLRN